jgi:acyl-CoA thioesterase I
MPDAPGSCDPHLDIVGFQYPLPHFKEALKSRRRIKVVAIGSSSTAGADGVLPFPPMLEMLLRQQKFYGRMIDVINRGVGGQEAPEELSRFESDAIGEMPSLLIWQVGTNAVYRYLDYSPDEVAKAIEVGLGLLSGLPMDVVLMDLQYTRALVDEIARSEDMVARIAAAGARAEVNVFRRFALMRRWNRDGVPLQDLDDGGRLHTSAWATNCVAAALSDAVAIAAA